MVGNLFKGEWFPDCYTKNLNLDFTINKVVFDHSYCRKAKNIIMNDSTNCYASDANQLYV